MTLATAYMVGNVTKDDIRVREVVYNENAWPPPSAYPRPEMSTEGIMFVSEELSGGKLVEAMDVDETIYERINAAYGTDYKLWSNVGRSMLRSASSHRELAPPEVLPELLPAYTDLQGLRRTHTDNCVPVVPTHRDTYGLTGT
jgi:hypothetical protein